MNEEFYISLIYKQLEGTLSETEHIELEVWLNEDDYNVRTYEAVQEVWKRTERQILPFEIQEEKEFKSLVDKIEQYDHWQKSNKTIGIQRRYFLIAASVLLMISSLAVWLFLPSKTDEIQHFLTNDEIKEIQLPDGTKVTLNQESSLTFFRDRKNYSRNAELNGEAFFEVSRDENAPFFVRNKNISVQVLGTMFNVRAYDSLKQVFIYVKEGKVRVTENKSLDFIDLTENEEALFEKLNRTLIKKQQPTLNPISWYTNELNYNDVSFSSVLEEIESIYKVQIEVENRQLEICRLTFSFSREKSVNEILNAAAIIFGATLESSPEGNYLIKNGECG
jgi:ferric-dicitrate binding protein FerR (iron transport regulator)